MEQDVWLHSDCDCDCIVIIPEIHKYVTSVVVPKSLVQGLHEWIEQLCDPEENFCETLRAQLDPGWEEEEDQDVRVSGFGKSTEYTSFHIMCLDLVWIARSKHPFIQQEVQHNYAQ